MAELPRNMGRATKATHQVAVVKKMKKIVEASSKSKVNKPKAASVANKQTSSHRQNRTLAKGASKGKSSDQENVDHDQELIGNKPILEESKTRSMDQDPSMSDQFSEMSSTELQRIESMLDKLSETQFRLVMLKKLSTSFTEEEIEEDREENPPMHEQQGAKQHIRRLVQKGHCITG